MELGELTTKTLTMLQTDSVENMPSKIMECVMSDNVEIYEKFEALVEDLSIDWIQKIYQYHFADRKEKGQDYTPKTLANLMARLSGSADIIIDMCAGSGALTIQKWIQNPAAKYVLYEFDETVIPFLLFNMALRNIHCDVFLSDVLQNEIRKAWIVSPGKKYGICKEVKM